MESGVSWSASEFSNINQGFQLPLGRPKTVRLAPSATAELGLLEQVPVGVAVYDADGALAHANAYFTRLACGDRLPSRSVADPQRWQGWAADGRELDLTEFPGERALRGEVVSPGVDLLHHGADGARHWLNVSASPVRDPGGEAVIGVVLLFLPLHDQGRAARLAVAPAAAQPLFFIGRLDASASVAAAIHRNGAYRTKEFRSIGAFAAVADFVSFGCVVVDLASIDDGPDELSALLADHAATLPIVVVGEPGASVQSAVAAMRAGATDYLLPPLGADDLVAALLRAAARFRPPQAESVAAAVAPADRFACLSRRERDVLTRLKLGGTNKSIGRELGISPRTVEAHRSRLMGRMKVSSLAELLQTAA